MSKVVIKQDVFISYKDLSSAKPNDLVLVNSDDFFQAYPFLVKIKANLPEVQEIYLKNAARCFNNMKTLSSFDTIPLTVYEARVYFANAQAFIDTYTFVLHKKITTVDAIPVPA